MEKKDKKIGLIVLGGAAVITGILLMKKDTPTEGGDDITGTIELELLDSNGNPVPHNSPYQLMEAHSYTISVTVKNNSTRLGSAISADLSVIISAVAGSSYIVSPITTTKTFAGGESKTFTCSLNIPDNTGGESGTVNVSVVGGGSEIASGSAEFNIADVQIVYGATITIGI
jgi:hypothetical protein